MGKLKANSWSLWTVLSSVALLVGCGGPEYRTSPVTASGSDAAQSSKPAKEIVIAKPDPVPGTPGASTTVRTQTTVTSGAPYITTGTSGDSRALMDSIIQDCLLRSGTVTGTSVPAASSASLFSSPSSVGGVAKTTVTTCEFGAPALPPAVVPSNGSAVSVFPPSVSQTIIQHGQ